MTQKIELELHGTMKMVTVEEVFHRFHNMIKVYFENGYENLFYTDVETGRWIEEDLGFTECASLIGSKIKQQLSNPIHVPKKLTWHYQYTNGSLFYFAFFPFVHDLQKFYQIFNQNRKYIYTLIVNERNDWMMLETSNLSFNTLDYDYLAKVVQALQPYAINTQLLNNH